MSTSESVEANAPQLEVSDPIYEGWEALNVYQLNSDQIWLAHSLSDAIEGAAIWYGRRAQDLLDEMSPPRRIGRLEKLIYAPDVTDLEAAAGAAAAQKLRDGYMPPTLVGLLNN